MAGNTGSGAARASREVPGSEPEDDLSPGERLALVDAERASASAAIVPDPRLIYGVWGVAWLIGFAGMYLARLEDGPVTVSDPLAGIAFFLLFVGAVAVTGWHMVRRFAGVRGVSSRVGAMYGCSWLMGFAAFAAIMASAQRAGVEEPVLGLLWTAGSGLVVGLLYLAGGALWQDRVMYGLGAWILVTSGAGALSGTPEIYLVMSLAGGGGFLLAAAAFALRSAKGSGATAAAA